MTSVPEAPTAVFCNDDSKFATFIGVSPRPRSYYPRRMWFYTKGAKHLPKFPLEVEEGPERFRKATLPSPSHLQFGRAQHCGGVPAGVQPAHDEIILATREGRLGADHPLDAGTLE